MSSYDGQLSIEARYPAGSFSTEEIDWLAKEVGALLRAVANAAR
ncbi:MAG: hypothetical protein ACRDTV_26715 [Mycobacterium sp.]